MQETRNVTKCRESRSKLEETVETLRKTHTDLLHSRDKCALEVKVCKYCFSVSSYCFSVNVY